MGGLGLLNLNQNHCETLVTTHCILEQLEKSVMKMVKKVANNERRRAYRKFNASICVCLAYLIVSNLKTLDKANNNNEIIFLNQSDGWLVGLKTNLKQAKLFLFF